VGLVPLLFIVAIVEGISKIGEIFVGHGWDPQVEKVSAQRKRWAKGVPRAAWR
jgi:hypothetical protein